MEINRIEILEPDSGKRGDLFGRLMGDLFHALGYDEPRLNIHKSGREVDIRSIHRTESKTAIAECKAHRDPIGGADINKFVGVFEAEKLRLNKRALKSEAVGYFASLSGFTETAIEQEDDLDNERVILLGPKKIIRELVNGRILVSIEKAIAAVNNADESLTLIEEADLVAFEGGWVWVVYFSDNGGQEKSHYSLVHAEGKPLVQGLANQVAKLDAATLGRLNGLKLLEVSASPAPAVDLVEAQKNYFNYLESECGEIQFEGLPTDKDAGSVRVRLESIFVPLHLE